MIKILTKRKYEELLNELRDKNRIENELFTYKQLERIAEEKIEKAYKKVDELLAKLNKKQ